MNRARLEGISVTRASRALPLKTALLLGAALFVAGFTTAVWTVGMIVTVRPTP